MTSFSRSQLLSSHGVSIWLDDLSRARLESGSLERMIRDANVVGLTTNPTIFATAIQQDDSYRADLLRLREASVAPETVALDLMCADVQAACDLFADIFVQSNGIDGRVSIEVSPHFADNTEATVEAGIELWDRIDRPNLLIKVPATGAGLQAVTELVARGISVNVTLIFSLPRYREVINAYLTGLERARERGHDLSTIQSVASFFISRLDTAVDSQLRELATPEALALTGKAALANAQLAYEIFTETLTSERAQYLLSQGAHPQRPLWASTGVKDAALPDTLYVTELVAPNVVNTMPEQTLNAVLDHAVFRGDTLTDTAHHANHVLNEIERLGISYAEVTRNLESEGIEKFTASYDEMLSSIREALTA